MKESIFRDKLGRFILLSNVGFAILIVIYYFFGGFTNGEFADLLKILAPIKSVYLTALIRYVIANRNVKKEAPTEEVPEITSFFAQTAFVIIFLHITSLIIITSMNALFKAIEFDMLINLIIGIETFFGIYVGMFMASMFKIEDEK